MMGLLQGEYPEILPRMRVALLGYGKRRSRRTKAAISLKTAEDGVKVTVEVVYELSI